LKVCEVFDSIQGEGTDIGLLTTFIRLSGCNLRCTFCDTKYALTEGTELSVEEILSSVRQWNVCITGGEPLIQDIKPLCTELARKRHRVTVETNGTIRPPDNLLVGHWIVSPKLSNSGMLKHLNMDALKWFADKNTTFKFVVGNDGDVTEVRDLVEKLEIPLIRPIVLQPNSMAFNLDSLLWRLAYVKWLDRLTTIVRSWGRPNTYVLPQLHVLIWGRRRGV